MPPIPIRFNELELSYGCHQGKSFELPVKDEPVVVVGNNGNGKSTILEALVRTPFGFARRIERDRDCADARKPRGDKPFRARLVLTDADGTKWSIERDFDGTEVELRRLDGADDVWRGDGNPGATNTQANEFRKQLESILGFSDLSDYENTACVLQGGLSDTTLSEKLLQIAAGGHAALETARQTVLDAHRAMTLRPITPDGRGANKPRRLEELQQQIGTLRDTLRTTQEAERKREPLQRTRDETWSRIGELREDVGLLESALQPLANCRAIETEHRQLEHRVRLLERARTRVETARRDADGARQAWDRLAEGPLYPDDFPQRVAGLAPLWQQRGQLEDDRQQAAADVDRTRPRPWFVPAVAGFGVAALGGVIAMIAGQAVVGVVLLAIGVVGGGALLLDRRKASGERAERQLKVEEIDGRITSLNEDLKLRLDDVPDADTLGPSTVDERSERFDRQCRMRDDAGSTRDELTRVVREATETLGEEAGPQPEVNDPFVRAESVSGRLGDVVGETRNALAKKGLELKQSRDGLTLPKGVVADADTVHATLEQRRKQLELLEVKLRDLDTALLETASDLESSVSIGDRLRALEIEGETIETRVTAHEHAYSLLGDAYDEFRAHDQQRLVGRISDCLVDMTGGRLGPLHVAGTLEETQVESCGVKVPLASPPLSYGEWHTGLFAIRLGAVDFLASAGIQPPVLVDDPFVHLDVTHAREMWRLLCMIAEQRQVIVATQDRLLLEELGIAPDIELADRVRATSVVEVTPPAGRIAPSSPPPPNPIGRVPQHES